MKWNTIELNWIEIVFYKHWIPEFICIKFLLSIILQFWDMVTKFTQSTVQTIITICLRKGYQDLHVLSWSRAVI